MTHPTDDGPALCAICGGNGKIEQKGCTAPYRPCSFCSGTGKRLGGPALKPSDEARRLVEAAVRRGIGHWTDLDESERTRDQLISDITHCVMVALEATPQNAGEAKPVAWKWRVKTPAYMGPWFLSEERHGAAIYEEIPLYTSPPAATDAALREALAALVDLDQRSGWHSAQCERALAVLGRQTHAQKVAALQATATGEKP